MGDVVTFKPRPRLDGASSVPVGATDLRAHLEEAAQTVLDAADKIIAALDHIDSSDDATPLATTIAGHEETSSEEVFSYCYAKAPAREKETAPGPTLGVVTDPEPEPEAPDAILEEPAETGFVAEPIPLPWNGAGNVISAAGCALLALVADP